MDKQDFYNKVVEFAQSKVGQEEIPGNKGFKDKGFELAMKRVGFNQGWAWCALFAELCWSAPTFSGRSTYLPMFKKLFSPSAVQTFKNFSGSVMFTVDKDPVAGAVVIWQMYKNGQPHWTGHAGIVESVEDEFINTIEGNTNSKGGREGIEVARKKRPLDFEEKERGLVLRGFIKV